MACTQTGRSTPEGKCERCGRRYARLYARTVLAWCVGGVAPDGETLAAQWFREALLSGGARLTDYLSIDERMAKSITDTV